MVPPAFNNRFYDYCRFPAEPLHDADHGGKVPRTPNAALDRRAPGQRPAGLEAVDGCLARFQYRAVHVLLPRPGHPALDAA